MRRVLVFFGIAIVFSFASRAAMACSCMEPGTPCESYGSAAAVFVGTVTGVRDSERQQAKDAGKRGKQEDREIDWGPLAYKFFVEQAYLGVTGSEIEIFTGRDGAACGVAFQSSQRYLVYAYRYKDKLTTSICTRTKPFNRATEDIGFLGTLSSAAPGVTISGTVNYTPDEARSSEVKSKPLSPDVLIAIEGESERKETRPDAEGSFRVSGLRPGKYKLTLRLPENLTTSRNEQELTLADRGCGVVRWYIVDNGRVTGRVVNADDGEPVPRIWVSLITPGSNIAKYAVRTERANDDGNFSFSAVPRGTYYIAVNFNRAPDPNDPTAAYPPSFYPGVVDQRQAQTITVGAGEKLSDFEIRIPPKRPDSVLTGTVVWADGSPVANAQLNVKDATYNENNVTYLFAADEQGRFKINGYSGQKFVIEARSNRPYISRGVSFDPMERSEPLRIKLENPSRTLRIVITKLR